MDWSNVCISHFNLALETAKLRRKTGSPKVVVLLFSSRKGPLFLLESWNMHASWCMLPTIILVSNRRVHGFQFPFLSCQKNCFISFHFNGVQAELFQRSTTAMLQRPGAMLEFTGMWTAKPPMKWQEATMFHFPKNLLDPRTTNKKTTCFTPSQHGFSNQWVAIIIPHGTWSTLRQELAWILGQATNILKQETLNKTGWIKHQNCIWCISECCCLMDLLNCLLYIAEHLFWHTVPFIDSEHFKHCQLYWLFPLTHKLRT